MSESTDRRHSGTFYTAGQWGELEEGQTLSCCHCGCAWILKKGSGKLRGWCQECMGFVCGVDCVECIPKEVMWENIEAGLPAKTPRKIIVPGS